jgi:CubicO group peptidase (beta-lactamase class C family)
MADPDRPEEPPAPDTQFQVASITKTFTAALVLQLRDAGVLDLSDRLEDHVPGTPHGRLTLRQLLTHGSGLQREPFGDVWQTLRVPPPAGMLADLPATEAVLPAGEQFHYSNLGYGLLGEVVARSTASTWEEALRERVLRPLGLSRTGAPVPPVARALFVDPYADRVLPEPPVDWGGIAAAGALWSTAADLACWAAFLAAPDPAVLAPATVREMCLPHLVRDRDSWSAAYGLGLFLARRDGRVLAGHSGAVSGFLSAFLVDPRSGIGAVVLTNSGRDADPVGLAVRLIGTALEWDPPPRDPWRPGPPVPEELEGALGRWWREGVEFVFRFVGGRLEARWADAPMDRSPAHFEREGPDVYRAVSGFEVGEVLRVVRDATGGVTELNWATYAFTREPLSFGQLRDRADLTDTGSGGGPR